MYQTFIPGVEPPEGQAGPFLWFVFADNRLLLKEGAGEGMESLPLLEDLSDLGLATARRHYLGTFDGVGCYSAEVKEGTTAPEGTAFHGLRSTYSVLGEQLFTLAGRAFQVLEWDRTHRYCGRCGTPMEQVREERARKCPNCGLMSFPRVSPAVIVLVRREDTILLARAARFPTAFYSTLAGFVEPGETLEETIRREIAEEVGVEVKNIRYFGSQPWPFPHSLMIGFTADYAGGDIQADGKEIIDAGWFTRDNVPQIPPKMSIARRLIDSFLEGE